MMDRMETVKAFCMKCRDKAGSVMVNPKEVPFNRKGGTKGSAMTGTCSDCGTKMFKILGKKQ